VSAAELSSADRAWLITNVITAVLDYHALNFMGNDIARSDSSMAAGMIDSLRGKKVLKIADSIQAAIDGEALS
jgi:hypothetical protein